MEGKEDLFPEKKSSKNVLKYHGCACAAGGDWYTVLILKIGCSDGLFNLSVHLADSGSGRKRQSITGQNSDSTAKKRINAANERTNGEGGHYGEGQRIELFEVTDMMFIKGSLS